MLWIDPWANWEREESLHSEASETYEAVSVYTRNGPSNLGGIQRVDSREVQWWGMSSGFKQRLNKPP